ncbi:MAG TPA: hypothetical protein VF681_06545 [Abditibacteriaceae bacterium]
MPSVKGAERVLGDLEVFSLRGMARSVKQSTVEIDRTPAEWGKLVQPG